MKKNLCIYVYILKKLFKKMKKSKLIEGESVVHPLLDYQTDQNPKGKAKHGRIFPSFR